MNLKSPKVLIAGTFAAVLTASTSHFANTASAAGAETTAAVAKSAYIYGYAPVYMERQRRNLVSVDKDMGDGRAPENTFGWIRTLASPDLKVIVMPNNDTLYSSSWMNLIRGPLLLTVPNMADRYYTFQFMDAFSNTFHYVGSRVGNATGGKFAIVGPNWTGTLPAGLSGTIKAPTSTIWVAARMAIAGPKELATVHALQDAVALANIDGSSVAIHNPKYAPLPPPEKMPPLEFYGILGDVLKAYPTPTSAQATVATFAQIDLNHTDGFQKAKLTPQTSAVLESSAKAAFAEIQQAKLGSNVNGWDFSMKNGKFGDDYLLRSAIAYRSLAGNAPEEAIYFNADKDQSGKVLSGAYRYEMRFAKGSMPPVNSFWSLTMYDAKDFLMVHNPINRYSIGDRTAGLKYEADGSLTIYIEHASPGKGKEGNWLPAPAGNFDVHLRTYGPKDALLNGDYKMPPLTRHETAAVVMP